MSWSVAPPPLRNTLAYDPTVIQQIARDLYSQADEIVSAASVKGVLGGGIIGAVIGALFVSAGAGAQLAGDTLLNSIGIAAVIGAVVGYAMVIGPAKRQALQLRYQAQLALCQMSIEANTRKPVSIDG